jgi:hypothetical protein
MGEEMRVELSGTATPSPFQKLADEIHTNLNRIDNLTGVIQIKNTPNAMKDIKEDSAPTVIEDLLIGVLEHSKEIVRKLTR